MIASQLGKADLFQEYWASGPKAPDEKAWIKLFDGADPVLILLDEMPPYFEDLTTRPVGAGTVADIATRAFANLLTAAGKKSNVCVVISDLWAAYQSGGALINRALDNARQELGRQERNITPVDLAANEIYDILRSHFFKSLDKANIENIAAAFGRKLEEAAKSKTATRGAEAIADEIAATYPFHPQLRHPRRRAPGSASRRSGREETGIKQPPRLHASDRPTHEESAARTATPFRPSLYELWNLLRILNAGADFVVGRELAHARLIGRRGASVVKDDEEPTDEKRPGNGCESPAARKRSRPRS